MTNFQLNLSSVCSSSRPPNPHFLLLFIRLLTKQLNSSEDKAAAGIIGVILLLSLLLFQVVATGSSWSGSFQHCFLHASGLLRRIFWSSHLLLSFLKTVIIRIALKKMFLQFRLVYLSWSLSIELLLLFVHDAVISDLSYRFFFLGMLFSNCSHSSSSLLCLCLEAFFLPLSPLSLHLSSKLCLICIVLPLPFLILINQSFCSMFLFNTKFLC